MQVSLNNLFIEISSNTSILQLLEDHLLYQEKGIAVAINDVVLPKKLWATTICQQDDNVLVIKASAGG